MRIIFMGSSTFALPALKKLVEQHHVIAVYTRAAKPAGRGMRLQYTPVAQYAETQNIPIFTPKNFKNTETIAAFKSLNPDIAVVAAYGLILPKSILDAPQYQCLNIHGSILPRWRGAAPIHRAIMAGDTHTGVAIMRMSEGLDEGDVYKTQTIPLSFSDTTGGNITYAHKITKDECLLDFKNQTAIEIIRKINALNPFPSAYFEHNKQRYKIHSAEILDQKGEAGFIDKNFVIYCKHGAIRPLVIQKKNKQKQHLTDFLNGETNNQV